MMDIGKIEVDISPNSNEYNQIPGGLNNQAFTEQT